MAYRCYKYANLKKSRVRNLIYYLPQYNYGYATLHLTPAMMEVKENVNFHFQDHLESGEGEKKASPVKARVALMGASTL